MFKKIILIAFATLLSAAAFAQDARLERSILYLTGASCLEDLSEDELERLYSFESRPLRLNLAPLSRLVSSGLLTRYQAASLRDYISRHGDVLSVNELALVDGFSEQSAAALEPFVSFESASSRPGGNSLEKGRVKTETLARGSVKSSEGETLASAGLKVRTGNEDRWELSLAGKKETLSASAALYGRGHLGKVVLGDYNARFGQGLLMWSGFSLSGFSSASAFARHPSGLSPAWTFTPSSARRGAAVDFTFSRVCVSAFADVSGLFGANATLYARSGQAGVTFLSPGEASVDTRLSLGKIDLFGEAAVAGGVVAALAGLTFNPAYGVRISALVRNYPSDFESACAGAVRSSTKVSDERGAALGLDWGSLSLTADAAFHPSKGSSQHKAVLKFSPQIGDFLLFSFRAVCRYRPADDSAWRSELRADATLTIAQKFSLKGCADLCRCNSFSWASYAECGFKTGSKPELSVYLRGTAFVVDNWDDRIYLYERDLQGSFNVPALYGRGCTSFLLTTLKWRSLKLGLRASFTAYPGMREKKPGKAELKIQCQFTL